MSFQFILPVFSPILPCEENIYLLESEYVNNSQIYYSAWIALFLSLVCLIWHTLINSSWTVGNRKSALQFSLSHFPQGHFIFSSRMFSLINIWSRFKGATWTTTIFFITQEACSKLFSVLLYWVPIAFLNFKQWNLNTHLLVFLFHRNGGY